MDSRDFATLSYCESTRDGEVEPLLAEAGTLDGRLQPGAQIDGRYVLRSCLGRGGMGEVYLADDERLHRSVAIKVVADNAAFSDAALEDALAKEARLGALLNHPNIATVYDFGVWHGSSYTVFEYIEGLTLREVLRRRRQLPLDEVRSLLKTLAAALDFAHSHGVVHRDLKPENICATTSGQFKILDLGLARELRATVNAPGFSGTPAYASPEQVACGPLDGRADQYALGVIAYELLCGRRVFEHREVIPLLQMHLNEPPPPLRQRNPQLPEAVERAVLKALEKSPARRFGTCQEFADALGSGTPAGVRAAAVIGIPESQRVDVYLCHVSEDSLAARQLALALERHGYSAWHYQRDALPGVSFVTQTDDAIRRSRASLLLVSRASLGAPDFAREIRQAHQANRPFLPVLVDLLPEELETHQPPWRSMLGGAAAIELGRGGAVELGRGGAEPLVERLARGLQALGIQPRPGARGDGAPPRRPLSGHAWATDANQIDISELHRVVFCNEVIGDFLRRRSRCFLSATKGLGKTLLLTYKRRLLTEQQQIRDEGALTLIPEGRPYLDFMSELKSLSARYEKPLSQLSTTKRLWSAALRISLLSHHPAAVSDDEAFELTPFPPRIQRWIRGSRVEPTVVFKELTSHSISEINRLIDDTENFLDQKLRRIHSGAMVFIDKVDQAVRQLSRAAWINVQAGLIEAAWDLMNANSHIKVFATIRHEAFVAYESDVKSNLFGATTVIRYSESELQDLMDTLARCYEGAASFKDFLGLNVVKHQRRPMPEGSFRFVHRHTLGRPRDFVAIASELSANQASLNERRFSEIVSQTSGTGLVSNIFDEMHVFLDCLQDKATRLRFLDLVKHNILSYDEALAVSAEFNGVTSESIEHFGRDSSDIFHPFRDLYMTGLLGVASKDAETGACWQKFRQPDDVVSEVRCHLPHSPYYFVHPALNGFIRQHRAADDYYVFQHVVVGERQSWEPYDEVFCQIEHYAADVADAAVANSLHDLLKRGRAALKSGNPEHLPLIFEFNDQWKSLHQGLVEQGHDDLVLWVEELASRWGA